MNLNNLSGLVTGSSQGIGYGCAIEMARAGANVAINYLNNPAGAEKVVEEIKQLGRKAIAIQGDVSDRQTMENMIEQVTKEFGSFDLFVANAVFSDRQPMLTADLDQFKRTIDVNMWGTFYGLRAAASKMVELGTAGSIVIVSSPHAVIPIPNAMAYNMAKAAIDQMARTAALELSEHGIRVNIMHPGWIDTPGERKFFSEEQLAAGAKKIPLRRLGTPLEVGKAVAYMLSPDAAYMTGSTFLIDGGITLPYWAYERTDE
jgi:glucose 1-dehydrogenase